MCMEAKNEYSEVLYCATSLLIVMLSAREIKCSLILSPLRSVEQRSMQNWPCFALFWAIFFSCPSDVACACLATLVDKDFQPLSRTV